MTPGSESMTYILLMKKILKIILLPKHIMALKHSTAVQCTAITRQGQPVGNRPTCAYSPLYKTLYNPQYGTISWKCIIILQSADNVLFKRKYINIAQSSEYISLWCNRRQIYCMVKCPVNTLFRAVCCKYIILSNKL